MGAKTKPFYRRFWFRAPSVLMVLVVLGAADNFGEPSTAAPSSGHRSSAALTPAKRADKGWFLERASFPDHSVGDGDFVGTVFLTNANQSTVSASFTLTVLANGQTVASLQGSANNVPAGKTVTVQLTSQDEYQPGPYALDFRTDASYH